MLTLRQYDRAALNGLSELFADARVVRYVGDGKPMDAPSATALMEKILRLSESDPSFWVWAVYEGEQYAGHAELKRRSGRSEYELIYILQQKRWGRSLGGSVVDLLISEARTRSIPFVIATVAPENVASIAILKRRGFVNDDGLSRQLDCPAYRLSLESPRG